MSRLEMPLYQWDVRVPICHIPFFISEVVVAREWFSGVPTSLRRDPAPVNQDHFASSQAQFSPQRRLGSGPQCIHCRETHLPIRIMQHVNEHTNNVVSADQPQNIRRLFTDLPAFMVERSDQGLKGGFT